MRLIEGSKAISDKNLQKLVMSGVGFHNAQLSPQDKNIVEDLFFQGDLIVQIL
jgi:replicative superfamily II helicase